MKITAISLSFLFLIFLPICFAPDWDGESQLTEEDLNQLPDSIKVEYYKVYYDVDQVRDLLKTNYDKELAKKHFENIKTKTGNMNEDDVALYRQYIQEMSTSGQIKDYDVLENREIVVKYLSSLDNFGNAVDQELFEHAATSDISIINKNKEVFKKFSDLYSVPFEHSDQSGDFESYDAVTGIFRTKGSAGSSFELSTLQRFSVDHNLHSFEIGSDGSIILKTDEEKYRLTDAILVTSGTDEDGEAALPTLLSGTIYSDTFPEGITIPASCLDCRAMLKHDGSFILEGQNIVLPNGDILIGGKEEGTKGKVILFDPKHVTLVNAEYMDRVLRIEVSPDGVMTERENYLTYKAKNTELFKGGSLVNSEDSLSTFFSDGGKCDSVTGSCIQRDEQAWLLNINARGNSKIEVDDQNLVKYLIVPQISDGSEVTYRSTHYDGSVLTVKFSDQPMKVKGDISKQLNNLKSPGLRIITDYPQNADYPCCTQIYGSAVHIKGQCLSKNFRKAILWMEQEYSIRVNSPLGIGQFYGSWSGYPTYLAYPPKDLRKYIKSGTRKQFIEYAQTYGYMLSHPQAVAMMNLCGGYKADGSCYKTFKRSDGTEYHYDVYELYNDIRSAGLKKISEGVAYSQMRSSEVDHDDAVKNLKTATDSLRQEYAQYLQANGFDHLGSKLDPDKSLSRSSCIGFLTLPLSQAYKETGYSDDIVKQLWTKRTLYAKEGPRSGKAYGIPLAMNLKEFHGWQVIYGNKDADNPEDMRFDPRGVQYGANHISSAKQKEYYGFVEVDEFMTNYNPNKVQRYQDNPKSQYYDLKLFGTDSEIAQAKLDAEALRSGRITVADVKSDYNIYPNLHGRESRAVEIVAGYLDNMESMTEQDTTMYDKLVDNPKFQAGAMIMNGGFHNAVVVKDINPYYDPNVPGSKKHELYVVEEHVGDDPNSKYQIQRTPLKEFTAYGNYIILVPPGTI
ncbi:hypothetical protein K9M79_05750 [Candidatus Woesearchaeota archaeon]|nr:hypothetical protein [Candidatus Woesearchaeota archaeon]